MPHTLVKGDRVRASWLQAKPLGTYSLAGVQPKFAATGQEVVGTVKHIRGDHPTSPTTVHVWILPDGCTQESEEVEVDFKHIVEVLPKDVPNSQG